MRIRSDPRVCVRGGISILQQCRRAVARRFGGEIRACKSAARDRTILAGSRSLPRALSDAGIFRFARKLRRTISAAELALIVRGTAARPGTGSPDVGITDQPRIR